MKNMWKDSPLVDVLEDTVQILQKSNEITEGIISKKIDLVEFVDSLGPALISTESDLRAKGTKFLSQILSLLPEDLLNDNQLNFIIEFYCNRLKDHHSVLPGVINGILALARMKNKPAGSCSKMLQGLFLNVPCQSQLREDRGNFFLIIKLMSESDLAELQAMGPDFIFGVIHSIDGERDPRNLMFLFSYMPEFIKKFPLGHLSDDMFEVFECYFPIDFHPTKNDPDTITRETLANALCCCLCSSPNFSEKCIELALEKIDSELIVAKMDSLNLLAKSGELFPLTIIEKHFDTIWSALRIEVLPGNSKDITITALKTIERILNASDKDKQLCENMLKIIFNSIVAQIADIDSRLFTQAKNILLICANANEFSSIYTANKFLPAIISQIDECNERIYQKSSLLEIIENLITKCIEKNCVEKITKEFLHESQMEFMNALEQPTLEQIGYDCLTKTVDIITKDNRLIIFKKFKEIICEKIAAGAKEINIKLCFYQYALKYPEEMMENVVKELLTLTNSTSNIFENLCLLVKIDYFSKSILDFIFEQIFVTKNDNIRLIMLNNLRSLLDGDDIPKELIDKLYQNYKIFDKFINLVHTNKLIDDELLQISIICNLIIKLLTITQQNDIVKNYLKIMNLNKTEDLYLTTGILGFIEKDINLDGHFEILVDELTRLSLANPTDEQIKKLCNHLLCSLFNKMPDTEEHRNILKKIVKLLTEEIEKHNKQAVEILSWISKGLLVRGHTDAADLIDTLISLLEHPSLSSVASIAFEVICIEFPNLHLPIIKYLFKQKLFQTILNKLILKLEHFTESHLTAISYVLKMTPHSVLKMNVEKIQKVLFKCLDLPNPTPILISLEIISKFLVEKDAHFQTHIQYLVPQFIKLSQFKNSMNIRIAALNSITSLTNYPTFMLLPVKQDVLYGLLPALDDRKRLVRNSAVKARTIWFLIGSPGEESTN